MKLPQLTSKALIGTNADGTVIDSVVSAINGIVKCNGSGVYSAAVAGTDYQAPIEYEAGSYGVSWSANATNNKTIPFSRTFSEAPIVVANIKDDYSYYPSGAYGYVDYVIWLNIRDGYTTTTQFAVQIHASRYGNGAGYIDYIATVDNT